MGRSRKYSYDLISKHKNFEEFISKIKNNEMINLSEWSIKLDMGQPTNLTNFLNHYNIDYKLYSLLNELGEEKYNQLKVEYLDLKISTHVLTEKYNVTYPQIYCSFGRRGRVKDRKPKNESHNRLKNKIESEKDLGNIKFNEAKKLLESCNIKFSINTNGKTVNFNSDWCKCGKSLMLEVYDILNRKVDENGLVNIICINCFREFESFDTLAARKKMKNNNTGYIGVFISLNKKKIPDGYFTKLSSKKVKLVSKKFLDTALSDKTLIEAAVYREKYIIENDLPHTRNFSNDELISNMEMLGQYGDIGLIKKRLGI